MLKAECWLSKNSLLSAWAHWYVWHRIVFCSLLQAENARRAKLDEAFGLAQRFLLGRWFSRWFSHKAAFRIFCLLRLKGELMKRPIWLLPLLLMLARSFALAIAAAAGPSGSLPAPALISPLNQARLHGFPRTVTFEWSKVRGARAYGLEIDYYAGRWASQAGRPTLMLWVSDSRYIHEFVGDQPGSWRVWAMDGKRRPGQVSEWFTFTFGPDNSILPPPPPDTAPDFSRLPASASEPVPRGKMRDLPVFDPKTGEACVFPTVNNHEPGFTAPKGIYTPEPEFPEAARKGQISGSVMLSVKVGEDGLIKRACIVRASRDDLGEQAINTVRKWRLEPAKQNGVPIPYDMTVEVEFRIARR